MAAPNALDIRIFDRHPVQVFARAKLPTRFGDFTIVSFVDRSGRAIDDVALVNGDVRADVATPTRIHSECLTGDSLGSTRCDCRDQLELALTRLSDIEGGVLLYLRQEGRGIGIAHKVAAYRLQDFGLDTVQANLHLGFDDDLRTYDGAAAMLEALGVEAVELHTNNPKKIEGLRRAGIKVQKRVPCVAVVRRENEHYLDAKRRKSGHLF
jgi:GTP cyclohydrolase II